MVSVPRASGIDTTIPLLREGYTFISSRCDQLGSDIFRTRRMGRPVTCVRGAAAAEMFYHPDRFTRQGAMPPTTLRLLQDVGSVQLKHGQEHRHREAMFLSLMTRERLAHLGAIADEEWRAGLGRWSHKDAIVLFDEAREILCRIACRWAGVPLAEHEVTPRTQEFAAMLDSAGSAGPRNWWAQLKRRRTERWVEDLVTRYRAGHLEASQASALAVIATHRDHAGRPLETAVAAVELINVLRLIVAVGRFITFSAVAMHEHPDARELARTGIDKDREALAHEVRRFYPFFPFIGGVARHAFTWSGHRFAKGDWVILDIHGTLHDARLWDAPQVFRPERFREWTGNPWTLIPQGAGDHRMTHRCPGEWATIDLMAQAAAFLAREIDFDVPAQDLSIALSHMPARPKSGFVMRNIRAA